MWISPTTLYVIVGLVGLGLCVLLFMLLKRIFKMKTVAAVTTTFFSSLLIVPVLIMVVMLQVSTVILVDESGATTYMVMGSSVTYELKEGGSVEAALPETGHAIINNTGDTVAVETVRYYSYDPGEGPEVELLPIILPFSIQAMDGYYMDYIFKTPPDQIETKSSSGKMSKEYLRFVEAGDADYYLYYLGEYKNGKPHGQGIVYDGPRKIFEGQFIEGKIVRE